ncbi:hypothetical protein MHYP_G00183110 [Metynnis hypsauchen]
MLSINCMQTYRAWVCQYRWDLLIKSIDQAQQSESAHCVLQLGFVDLPVATLHHSTQIRAQKWPKSTRFDARDAPRTLFGAEMTKKGKRSCTRTSFLMALLNLSEAEPRETSNCLTKRDSDLQKTKSTARPKRH